MKNKERERFLDEEVASKSAKKAYTTLFNKIDNYISIKNIGGEWSELDWTKDDIIDFLKNSNSKSISTMLTIHSLLKKYLLYIGNYEINHVDRSGLKYLDIEPMAYINKSELIKKINEQFINELDKALFILMRNGIRGLAFSELTSLKLDDIQGEKVYVNDRVVILNTTDAEIVQRAKLEDSYRMNIKSNGRIQYEEYEYNPSSVYFWRNRPNKFHQGLTPIKPDSAKEKISKQMRMLNINGLSASSLVNSYIVDKIIEEEQRIGIIFTEKQIKSFISTLGIKCHAYGVYELKERVKSEKQ